MNEQNFFVIFMREISSSLISLTKLKKLHFNRLWVTYIEAISLLKSTFSKFAQKVTSIFQLNTISVWKQQDIIVLERNRYSFAVTPGSRKLVLPYIQVVLTLECGGSFWFYFS